MPDLFISYSSKDEVWARRFFDDIRSRFPTIKPFWAPGSIPPGAEWRPVFQDAARDATNFVVFWSSHAQQSNEVGPEIASFLNSQQANPKAPDGGKRTLFYIPLENGVDYGPLTAIQGFTAFRGVYEKEDAPDRGIAKLDVQPGKAAWSQMVRAIGNTILEELPTQPVTLALMVLTSEPVVGTDYLDRIINDKMVASEPSLGEFLQSAGLSLVDAKARYGDSAFDWRPFGTAKTIIDLAEDVREKVNANLDAAHQFHWRPIDFVAEVRKLPDVSAVPPLVKTLSDGPSVVVTDPISLFHTLVQNTFRRLDDYAKRQQSMIVSISPIEAVGANQLYSSLLGNSRPVLNAHLDPQILAFEPFAFCGVDVQHAVQVERLIRNGLGYYYLQKRRAEAKPLLTSGS